jgi:hypothetical protein
MAIDDQINNDLLNKSLIHSLIERCECLWKHTVTRVCGPTTSTIEAIQLLEWSAREPFMFPHRSARIFKKRLAGNQNSYKATCGPILLIVYCGSSPR